MNDPRHPRTPATRSRAALGAPALLLAASLLGACAVAETEAEAELIDEVYEAIRQDPRLGTSQVIVSDAGGGVVTLNGFIENMVDEQSIIDAAASVEGVTRVDSNLTQAAD